MAIKNRFKKKKSVIIIILVLIVILVLPAILFKNLISKRPDIEVVFHGTKTENFDYSKSIYSARLKSKLEKILIDDNGFLIEDFNVEWIEGKADFNYSTNLLFSDQIKLLSFYVRQNDKRSFARLYGSINDKFMDERGLFAEYVDTQSINGKGLTEILVYEQIYYARVLLEGYSVFKNKRYYDMAENISKLILPLCQKDNIVPSKIMIALPPPSPTPDFAATPTPKPEITPVIPPEDITYLSVTDLSKIDLYALLLLSQIDTAWNGIYDNTLAIIKNSYMQGDFSYFRPAYDVTTKTYIPFTGDAPLFVTAQQVRIMSALAETGEINYPAFSYMKQILLNTNNLFATYQIPSGTPGTQAQSIEGYSLLAKLSRIVEDEQVYNACIEKIFWNTATSPTSPIFGLVFEREDENSVKVNSGDVVSSLLSLY